MVKYNSENYCLIFKKACEEVEVVKSKFDYGFKVNMLLLFLIYAQILSTKYTECLL